TTNKLDEASHTADERERSRKMLENQLNLGSDRTEILEVQLKEARTLAAESDKKYDEVARKLLIQENELEKAEERAKRSETKCSELEQEMKNLHHQLKSFLARIDDAQNKEQSFEDQIRRLSQHLKD
ncbi:unnamed protein product, partial [Adineta steineri]